MSMVHSILLLGVAAVLIPMAVLVGECLLSLLPQRRIRRGAPAPRPRVAVLIAAHNEAADITATLASLRPQLHEGDRLVAVADNCNDATARLARGGGAEVCERFDPRRRGKGYALDYGLCFLAQDPPEVVLMVDADCIVHAGAVDELVRQVERTGRPAQALYLMDQPPVAQARDLVSALAFMVKNLVRPMGLHRIGLPCPLTGSGMAFPWVLIRRQHLATGNTVEDMQLGLDIAMAGAPATFCPSARITGRLPSNPEAARTQRTRWEHGHLRTLRREVVRLLWAGIRHGRPDVLALALDLSVPPLSLVVMVWSVVTPLAALAALFHLGPVWPVAALVIGGGAMAATLLAVWFKFGRSSLPLSSLLAAPLYLLWKVPLYIGIVVRPQRGWVRTERDLPQEA